MAARKGLTGGSIVGALTVLFLACSSPPVSDFKGQDPTLCVPVASNLTRLIREADTDGDKKITRLDAPGDFDLIDEEHQSHSVHGYYSLSILLQELKFAEEHGLAVLRFPESRLYENPVDRTSRQIRQVFWDSLTRRIDEQGLVRSLADPKTSAAGVPYVYVPSTDPAALKYFKDVSRRNPRLHLVVRPVPKKITRGYLEEIRTRPGLLTLKLEGDGTGKLRGVPFVVPGGRFNEMYGWDSYFIALGLIEDGRVRLAKEMAENQAYEIEHFGKILNANRTYYLTRSQPPFFTSLIRSVYDELPKSEDSRTWLRMMLTWAIKEYRTVWMAPPRVVHEYWMSRYYDDGEGPCPEVEPGHYDALIRKYAVAAGLTPAEYLSRYDSHRIKNAELATLFKNDRAVRESGHDTTYRFDLRAAEFLTVDLNSLLYKYERDIAELIETEFHGTLIADGRSETSGAWYRYASDRKAWFDHLFWDNEKGYYFDYDMGRRKQSTYISATGFYPLWAGLASPEQAQRVLEFAKKHLEAPGGLAASAEESRGALRPDRPARQWDFPYGWAPHQILAWEGLRRYGMGVEAERLAYRWLYTITKNARDFNGTVTEKYNVVTGSHEVFAEYGNVGRDFSYITREGFGWVNASYQVGLKLLSAPRLKDLKEMRAPE